MFSSFSRALASRDAGGATTCGGGADEGDADVLGADLAAGARGGAIGGLKPPRRDPNGRLSFFQKRIRRDLAQRQNSP